MWIVKIVWQNAFKLTWTIDLQSFCNFNLIRIFNHNCLIHLYFNDRGKFNTIFYRVLLIEYEYSDTQVQFLDDEFWVFCSPSTGTVGLVQVLGHLSLSTSANTLKTTQVQVPSMNTEYEYYNSGNRYISRSQGFFAIQSFWINKRTGKL